MSSIATIERNAALGARLAAVRAATGLSQNAFAESLGVSPRAYVNYERGEREMPVALFRTLYEIRGIDPAWLLVGPEAEPVRALERQLDLELLEELMRIVEEALRRAHKTLKPAKKARLVGLAYARCIRSGQVNVGEVRDMLSLAA
ncbi:MAG: helix-turn-helix transcriptional regulator [Xanthomonadales bacterium]|nr:helix-turn-helix transcriptional regulator [Xanthomonadales bacterium]ODU93047.1 MAG: hypothetical protein ABT18_09770 [Rhodanobacter sp. SCN 66-43]OJY83785.1 MAG: hypothetical protein BGP23_14245 [Xanthomonadales bacterium 66-474]